jgi:hypothetical protein
VQVFYRLFIYVLDIQLSRVEGWVLINWFSPAHPVPAFVYKLKLFFEKFIIKVNQVKLIIPINDTEKNEMY